LLLLQKSVMMSETTESRFAIIAQCTLSNGITDLLHTDHV